MLAHPAGTPHGPAPDSRERRLVSLVIGYTLAANAITLAWAEGAGVTTSESNFYSGPPTPSSVGLLFVAVGLLATGAAIVTVFGSIYGNETEPVAETTTLRLAAPGWRFGQLAVYFAVLGVGLLLMGLSLPLGPWGLSSLPSYLSPAVLFVPATLDGVGLGTLALGISFFILGRKRHRPEFRAWWRRTGRYVTVVGVVIIVIVAALLLVPVRQSFSTQLGMEGSDFGGLADESFPAGIAVSGSWSTNPEGPVHFTIQDPSGTAIYTANASSGTFSFTTIGTPGAFYIFILDHTATPETVSVNGSYVAPIWSWPPGEPGEPTVAAH
ncbi:MAG: hypothetical protein ABSE66_05250 [Thermoplasmata archaeon]